MTMISRPDEAGLRTLIEALPEMLDEPNAEGWSLVRRSDVIRALDAARARPDEAGLREAVQAYVDWQYRQRDAPRFTLTALRAALAQPAVPVAGAEDVAEERLRLARSALVETGYFTEAEVGPDVAPRIIELVAALRAAQPEDDGLDAAWKEAEAALPKGNDLWLAATGPGYVASTTYPGGERTVEAWAQSDRTLPNYVPNATPATALRALAVRLSESSEGVERRDGA